MKVLYLDNHLLALEKPANLLSQPDGSGLPSLECLGKQWLKQHFQKPGNVFLTPIHRLDKPVSGIVLFARTSKALSRLNQAQRAHQFQKEYQALVEGILQDKQGELEHYLLHDEFYANVVAENTPGAKKCLLKYSALDILQDCSLLKINLLTGRYHQIRAQLSAFGYPIRGDGKYGSKNKSERIFLHQTRLIFPHPITQEPVQIDSCLPDYFHD